MCKLTGFPRYPAIFNQTLYWYEFSLPLHARKNGHISLNKKTQILWLRSLVELSHYTTG